MLGVEIVFPLKNHFNQLSRSFSQKTVDQLANQVLIYTLASRVLYLGAFITATLTFLFFLTGEWHRLPHTAIPFFITVVSIFVLNRGRIRLAIAIAIISVFAVHLTGLTMLYGLNDPSLQTVYFLLILSAIFLGQRTTTALGAVVVVWAILIYSAEIIGWREVLQPPSSTPSNVIITVSVVGLTVLVLRYTGRRFRKYNEELLQTKREAETANAAKSAFLANISHELRTPLTAIIGLAETVSEDLDDGLIDLQHTSTDMKQIKTAANHLLSLINDILDLTKIEAQRMQITPQQIYLPELLDQVATLIHPLIIRQNNRFNLNNVAGEIRFTSDPTKVRQILFNLLHNATKFTENGAITLHVFNDPQVLTFIVQDTGIGIPAAELEHIFEPFRQVEDSLARSYAGSGLGLAICQRLADLLEGKIDVVSMPGKGTTFTFHIPLHQPGIDQPKSRTDAKTGSARVMIPENA